MTFYKNFSLSKSRVLIGATVYTCIALKAYASPQGPQTHFLHLPPEIIGKITALTIDPLSKKGSSLAEVCSYCNDAKNTMIKKIVFDIPRLDENSADVLQQQFTKYIGKLPFLESFTFRLDRSQNSLQILTKLVQGISEELSKSTKLFDCSFVSVVPDLYYSPTPEDTIAQCFTMALHKVEKLTSLTMGFARNRIGVPGAEAIAAAVCKPESLINFNINLQGNDIYAPGAEAIAAALPELKNLTNFNINLLYNYIGTPGAEAIAAALPKLKKLANLIINLEHNNVVDEIDEIDEGAEIIDAIAKALPALKNLTSLTINLKHCDIVYQAGAKAIAATLPALKNLTSLTVMLLGSGIGVSGAEAIAQALLELKNLTSLTINTELNDDLYQHERRIWAMKVQKLLLQH